MNIRRFGPLRWFDGLRGRIAAALLIALLVQFIGSDIIFERIEAQRMEHGRAQRLADWLSFADEFAGADPDAAQRMTALWQPDLVVSRSAGMPPGREAQSDAEAARVEMLVRSARPQMDSLDFRAAREGRDLTGSMRLDSGGWLTFRAKDYFTERSQLYHYMTSALLLLLCVVLIVLLFGRMIARPLKRIADAAERVGGEENVPIVVEGPREVRQVAATIDRMQARLLAQLRDRVQAMAAMSHDLRTPLARMRLNAASVEDADTRAALQHDVDEMEGFVSSVLDYLRGDEAEAERRADIASIVMTVVDEARDRGEVADYAGPRRLETVTRPLKLKRLVRNIVQNATRHAGQARVRLEAEAETIRILVTDDGPGIPEGELEAVFEPFHRIEASRNRQTGGSGLGLPIARRLVTRLGGTIHLRNRDEGGLEVIIALPGPV
ncbi:MAG: ATP-binding protein [Sphingobium sp.]